MHTLTSSLQTPSRLAQIARARVAVMREGRSIFEALPPSGPEGAWIERSWHRCLAQGFRAEEAVAFDLISPQARRRLHEAHEGLMAAAQPTLQQLGHVLASTRYFAILTNERGVVIEAHGPIDREDRRAQLITRPGVNLSESSVGTTAIGAALAELQPVWLHRGEHFFEDTSCYSCAGAPILGPDGHCVGMLDLTGIDAVERPELKHLVAQAARAIENALTQSRPHRLMLRLNWPGRLLGSDEDGLLALDGEGNVRGANSAARQMIPALQTGDGQTHCSELFAQSWEPLFDQADRLAPQPLEMMLWSGLRPSVLPVTAGAARTTTPAPAAAPLREVEISLIRKAVADARGNVARAAKALGISRATVYRKLAQKSRP
jgi:transcriptional regulator of acetoin/glycerol metabolism